MPGHERWDDLPYANRTAVVRACYRLGYTKDGPEDWRRWAGWERVAMQLALELAEELAWTGEHRAVTLELYIGVRARQEDCQPRARLGVESRAPS